MQLGSVPANNSIGRTPQRRSRSSLYELLSVPATMKPFRLNKSFGSISRFSLLQRYFAFASLISIGADKLESPPDLPLPPDLLSSLRLWLTKYATLPNPKKKSIPLDKPNLKPFLLRSLNDICTASFTDGRNSILISSFKARGNRPVAYGSGASPYKKVSFTVTSNFPFVSVVERIMQASTLFR